MAADQPSGRSAVHVDWGAQEVWVHQAGQPPQAGQHRDSIPPTWQLDHRDGMDTVVDQDGAVHIGPIVVPAWSPPGKVRQDRAPRVRVQFEQRTGSMPAGFRRATVYRRDGTGRITGDPVARVWVAWTEPDEATAVPTATGPVATVPDLQQGGFFERATVRGGTVDLWGTGVPVPGIRSGTEVGIVFDRDGPGVQVVTLPADPATGAHRVLTSAAVLRPAAGRYTPRGIRYTQGEIVAGRDPLTQRPIVLSVGPNRRLPVDLVPNFGDSTYRTVDPGTGADLMPARTMREGWRLRHGVAQQSTVDTEGSAHVGPLRVGVGASRASRRGGRTGTTPGAPIRIVGEENAAAVTVWGITPDGAAEVLARVPVRWEAQRDPVPEGMGPVPDTRHAGRFERATVTSGRVAYRGVPVRLGSAVRDGTDAGVRYDPDFRAVVAYDLDTRQPLAAHTVPAEPQPVLQAGRNRAVGFGPGAPRQPLQQAVPTGYVGDVVAVPDFGAGTMTFRDPATGDTLGPTWYMPEVWLLDGGGRRVSTVHAEGWVWVGPIRVSLGTSHAGRQVALRGNPATGEVTVYEHVGNGARGHVPLARVGVEWTAPATAATVPSVPGSPASSGVSAMAADD